MTADEDDDDATEACLFSVCEFYCSIWYQYLIQIALLDKYNQGVS